MAEICPSCREPLDYPSGDGCAAMTKHESKKKPMACDNITLDTDELGIWLVDETDEGPQQMGHISWVQIAKGVKGVLLLEMIEDMGQEFDRDE